MFVTKCQLTVAVILLGLIGFGVCAQFLAGQTPGVDSQPAIAQKAEVKEKAEQAAPALAANSPKLFTVLLHIIDLVPQKGQDGKIGPGKKDFDESELTGSTENVLFAMQKLQSKGLVIGTRHFRFTAIENQEVEFSTAESKKHLLGAAQASDGRVSSSLGPKSYGAIARAKVHSSDDKNIKMDLIFNESRPYPPDLGYIKGREDVDHYIHGLWPTLEVGAPALTDKKDGRVFQVYEPVSHTLKATLKIPLGGMVLAPEIKATTTVRSSMPPKRTPIPAQIMVIARAQTFKPAGKMSE